MHSIKDTVKQLIGKSLDAYNKKYTSPINNRIDNIVAQAGTDNTEIVDARIDSAGINHTTLNNRILAETKMTDEKLIEYSGSNLSVDDTMPGYLQNIEIKGNTIQNEDNLEDIRSVGDKVEGQELYEIPVLSRGKNLNSSLIKRGNINANTGIEESGANTILCSENFIPAKPETIYVISSNISIGSILLMCYNENKEYLGYCNISNGSFKTKLGTKYVKFRFAKSPSAEFTDLEVSTIKVQLEEGTQATPYEPYQEDKLTILSPTQLEKVGDVADRIVCKDGVWGVEKNIKTVRLNSKSAWYSQTNKNGIKLFNTKDYLSNGISNRVILCDALTVNNGVYQDAIDGYSQILAHKNGNYSQNIYISKDFEGSPLFTAWLDKNPINIKYVTETEPQFIPLPHSQQVKLRTFANKTNISFLTETEGTIKAQVPKSLGATVNTHTEQINNLNKELDRVKKLEESTVSTVTTESDFTTVEATSNGYFEDVKLEGKTMANIVTTYDTSKFSFNEATKQEDGYYKLQYGATVNDSNVIPRRGVHLYKPNTTYTLIVDIKENTAGTLLGISPINSCIDTKTISKRDFANLTGISTITFKTREDITISDKGVPTTYDLYFGIWKDGGDLSKHITFKYWVLEGDHTQNPPSYFEGLKSVGEDTDEIVVSSVNENLFDTDVNFDYGNLLLNNRDTARIHTTSRIKVCKNTDYYIKSPSGYLTVVSAVNENNVSIKDLNTRYTEAFVFNTKEYDYIGIQLKRTDNGTIDLPNFDNSLILFNKGTTPKPYTPYQSDKKRLLFYNEETQTWEKPILREWDSIEKHADGKYYYHQRSGEVVLNGSENIIIYKVHSDVICFNITIEDTISNKSTDYFISDKINFNKYCYDSNVEGIAFSPYINRNIYFNITTSKLSTQDVQGFKQWLQANNVTVVYQLAQEKVYECTNIDLITYANETNFIVESGVISPKTTLKVHNNISNVVSLLQKKVSLLESNMTKYMITQNRMQLASTYSADSVTFKVDYALCSDEVEYNEDLYNLILNNILVGKDNYDYNKMFNIILDYASWNQISWEQFDILVGVMDSQHNPPIEEETPVE